MNRFLAAASAALLLTVTCAKQESASASALEKRDQFRALYAEEVGRLSSSMESLRGRIAQESAEARRDLDAALVKLGEKKAAIDAKVKELAAASADRWEEIKTSLETMKLELKQEIDELAAKLKK